MNNNKQFGRLEDQGRRIKREAEASGPKAGDYLITRDQYGVDTWFRIGLIEGDTVYATHARAPVIRRFNRSGLKFRELSSKAQKPVWGD